MKKIEFKDYPNTSTPLNAENLNHNFNELNKANIYSTEEQVVGTWLDKPLYRKTIYVESLPNTTTGKFDMGVSNVDTFMFDLSHSFWFNATTSTPFMLAHTNSTYLAYSVLLSCNNRTTGQFEIITGLDRSGYSAYVTILYTKTTDSKGNKL